MEKISPPPEDLLTDTSTMPPLTTGVSKQLPSRKLMYSEPREENSLRLLMMKYHHKKTLPQTQSQSQHQTQNQSQLQKLMKILASSLNPLMEVPMDILLP